MKTINCGFLPLEKVLRISHIVFVCIVVGIVVFVGGLFVYSGAEHSIVLSSTDTIEVKAVVSNVDSYIERSSSKVTGRTTYDSTKYFDYTLTYNVDGVDCSKFMEKISDAAYDGQVVTILVDSNDYDHIWLMSEDEKESHVKEHLSLVYVSIAVGLIIILMSIIIPRYIIKAVLSHVEMLKRVAENNMQSIDDYKSLS